MDLGRSAAQNTSRVVPCNTPAFKTDIRGARSLEMPPRRVAPDNMGIYYWASPIVYERGPFAAYLPTD